MTVARAPASAERTDLVFFSAGARDSYQGAASAAPPAPNKKPGPGKIDPLRASVENKSVPGFSVAQRFTAEIRLCYQRRLQPPSSVGLARIAEIVSLPLLEAWRVAHSSLLLA
jgi:hypothetical protein